MSYFQKSFVYWRDDRHHYFLIVIYVLLWKGLKGRVTSKVIR